MPSGTTVLACGPSALSDLSLDRRQIVQLLHCGARDRSNGSPPIWMPRRAVAPLRNRKFADSPLEGTGFELRVRERGESACRACLLGTGRRALPTDFIGYPTEATRSAIAVAGCSAGCGPVPSNRTRQKARQPDSPRSRTRSSNPVPSSGESATSTCWYRADVLDVVERGVIDRPLFRSLHRRGQPWRRFACTVYDHALTSRCRSPTRP